MEKNKYLSILKHFDDLNSYEKPSIPFENLSQKVYGLQSDLEDFMNSKLVLTGVQDASFYGYISLSKDSKTPSSVRISNFGKLITIVGNFDQNAIPTGEINTREDTETIINIINTNGFSYIPIEILLLDYSGENNIEAIIQKPPTWWDRYFGYI